MSKIIYYLGAGASYGRKDARVLLDKGTENERLIVHEGLPVVNEIVKSLLSFKEAVKNAPINTEGIYTIMNTHSRKGSQIIQVQYELLKDIDFIYNAAREHATIDTYAKKLFLTGRNKDLERLKNVLSVFFVWAQLEGRVDQRYDTFLANILQENLCFPKEVSIISWNYDSQFEIAYKYYTTNGSLPIFEKNADGDLSQKKETGRIFKVNGSANFGDFNLVNSISKNGSVSPIIQLIECYSNLYADTGMLGFQLNSHLSFAWETSEKQSKLMDAIKKQHLMLKQL